MNEVFRQSMFVGVTISLIAYEIGLFLKKKFGLAVLNPLLVSIIIVILSLIHILLEQGIVLKDTREGVKWSRA